MLKIKLLQNVYETTYPTVGQCIDIKRLEMTLSGNKMPQLITSNLVEDSEIALDIKAISIISILFPKVKEDLKCNSLLDLQYDDWKEVLKVFNEEIFPWYMNWKNKIRGIDIDKELKDDTNSGTEA